VVHNAIAAQLQVGREAGVFKASLIYSK